MDGREKANMLLAEFGRGLGLEGVGLDQDGSAILGFGDIYVLFALMDEGNTLVMSAPIPESAGPKPQHLLEALLAANFMWRGAGGATLALDGPDGQIVLQAKAPLAELYGQALSTHLSALLDATDAWRAQATVTRAAQDLASPESDDETDGLLTIPV